MSARKVVRGQASRGWDLLFYLAALASVAWFLRESIAVLRHITGSWYTYSLAPARILAGGSHAIYSLTLQAQAVTGYLGVPASPSDMGGAFDHPPIEALLLVPLSGFGVHTSQLIFTLITLTVTGAGAWLLFHNVLPHTLSVSFRAAVVGMAVCTLPAATGMWGLFAPMLLLPAAGAFVLAERNRNFAAGLCLGVILMMRPQLVWLLPILALGARQWRMFAGLCGGGVVLVVSTVLIVGPDHVLDWPAAVLRADVIGSQVYTIGLPGWIGFIFSSPVATYVSFAMVVILASAGAWRYGPRLARQPGMLVAAGLALAVATAPHVETWDFILLAVPLCVWARTNPYRAMTVAVILDVIEFITDGQSDPIFLYLIVLVPFAIAAGLWSGTKSWRRQRRFGLEPAASYGWITSWRGGFELQGLPAAQHHPQTR